LWPPDGGTDYLANNDSDDHLEHDDHIDYDNGSED